MARTDWFMGLPKRAIRYLEKNGRWGKNQILDDEGNVIKETPQLLYEMGTKYTWFSMFGEENPLRIFPLKNGKKVYEIVQADPWASGPNIFTCLANEKGRKLKTTMWKDKEIWEVI